LYPVPRDRGVSDQRLQTRGGERWPGNSFVSEMRHEVPAVQAASSRRANRASRGPRDGGAGNRSQVCRTRPVPTAVDRRPANSRGKAGRLKREVHRGRDGANLTNTARGTPWKLRTCGTIGLRQASMSRGVEVRGSSRTLASRAPSVLVESGGQHRNTAYPEPQRIRAIVLVLARTGQARHALALARWARRGL